eukprot:6610739-Prymnesium_polylepis.1
MCGVLSKDTSLRDISWTRWVGCVRVSSRTVRWRGYSILAVRSALGILPWYSKAPLGDHCPG